MKEAIDLYAKLLIGTFSFIGPSFTLLIPIFYPAIQRSQLKHGATLNLLQLRTQQALKENDFLNVMEKISSELKIVNRIHKKESQLLMPGRQVKRLFLSLFSSILLIIVYYFQRSTFSPYRSHSIKLSLLIISVVCFLHCLAVLWQLFCLIIRIKMEEKVDISNIQVQFDL